MDSLRFSLGSPPAISASADSIELFADGDGLLNTIDEDGNVVVVNGSIGTSTIDAAQIISGVIDPDRLGTSAVGAGRKVLLDDGSWGGVTRWTGTYDNAATYYIDDILVYGGVNYIVTADASGAGISGHTPPNGTYYDVYAGGNVATDLAQYQLVLTESSQFDALPSGVKILYGRQTAPVGTSFSSQALTVTYLDPALYTVPAGYTLKAYLDMSAITNNTAPTVSFTAGLYPFTSPTGGANIVQGTVGTVVTGSTAVVTTPAANTLTQANSGDFTFPTAGYYALGVAVSGSTAANASQTIRARLLRRMV